MSEFSYLNVVEIVEQRWFLHTEVVRDQSVETIGQIQYLGLGQWVWHSLSPIRTRWQEARLGIKGRTSNIGLTAGYPPDGLQWGEHTRSGSASYSASPAASSGGQSEEKNGNEWLMQPQYKTAELRSSLSPQTPPWPSSCSPHRRSSWSAPVWV